MPKPTPEPKPLDIQESTTTTRRLTCVPFTVELDRGDSGVTALRVARHGRTEVNCRSCDKPNPVPAFGVTVAELDQLVRLLTQVRDEKIATLEKFGVEG